MAEGNHQQPLASSMNQHPHENMLWCACATGTIDWAKAVLEEIPDVDVNWQHAEHRSSTAIHQCCRTDNEEILKLLLAHPKIDVNLQIAGGWTPLLWACKHEKFRVIHMLLQDPRVDINLANEDGITCIRYCTIQGWDHTARWVLAFHGDKVDVSGVLAHAQTNHGAPIIQVVQGRKEIHRIVTEFLKNKPMAMFEQRLKLEDWPTNILPVKPISAVKVFALMVLLNDGYLGCPSERPRGRAERFYAMVTKLPMELQMMICHRLYGSGKLVIRADETELAFRHLFKLFHDEEEEKKALAAAQRWSSCVIC